MQKEFKFLIESDILNKLQPKLLEAAIQIKSAIVNHNPVIIRHHADCDGYCAAVALERAILPIILDNHGSERNASKHYKRYSSNSPFYNYIDALRDLSGSLYEKKNFRRKNPLIILLDLGDIAENLTAIKRVKINGIKVIVIDHHNPGTKANLEEMKKNADVFISPYDYDFDSSLVCGMICTELALLINPYVKDIKFLPALAGTADKSDKEEFQKYLKISKYSSEFLKKFAACVDYETHYLKFNESRELINQLLTGNHKPDSKIINLIYSEFEKKMSMTKIAVKEFVEMKKIDSIKLIKIDCEKILSPGDFPNSSKIVRIAHELYNGQRITIGLLSDAIIFRVNDVNEFNVNDVVNELKKTKPSALIKGGGHEFAGTLKFIKAAKEEVLEYIENYIKLLKQKRF